MPEAAQPGEQLWEGKRLGARNGNAPGREVLGLVALAGDQAAGDEPLEHEAGPGVVLPERAGLVGEDLACL